MTPPRTLWTSASLSLLIVALSASYYFLHVLPAAERQRNEVALEEARQQARDKQMKDCAEEARRTGQDMGKYSSGFGSPSSVSGVSNHYNEKLGKCIVDVQTVDKNGTAEFVMDAYEQASILWCSTRFSSQRMQRVCMDSENKQIDPTEADKRIDRMMRE